MQVLVTRPPADAARTAAALERAGHEALIAPVSVIVGVEAPAPPGPFVGVIVTSARALAHAPVDLIGRFAGKTRLYAVGERTGEAARAKGFDVAAAPGGDAQDLARLIAMEAPAGPLLYLAGEPRKPALETLLAEAGCDVTPLVVYRSVAAKALTEDAAQAIRSGEIDAVLHYSRESAARFADLAGKAGLEAAVGRVLHACLSADVAVGLAGLPAGRIRIAARPDEAALLTLLDEGH